MTISHTLSPSHPKGFTLLELLVGLGIGLIVVLGIVQLYLVSWRAQYNTHQSISAEQQGRQLLKAFVAELRTAAAASSGAYPLDSVEENEIIFYSNIDGDTLRERVRYWLDGTTLKKGVLKPTGSPLTYNPVYEEAAEIVTGVANGMTPLFTYYDQAYEGTADPLEQPVSTLDVRVVGLTLLLPPPQGSGVEPVTIETKVAIRNLKSN